MILDGQIAPHQRAQHAAMPPHRSDAVHHSLTLTSAAWPGAALERRQAKYSSRTFNPLSFTIGTGLVAREEVTLTGDPKLVLGLDPSSGMLAEARRALQLSKFGGRYAIGDGTWQSITKVLPPAPQVRDLLIRPDNPAVLYAGTLSLLVYREMDLKGLHFALLDTGKFAAIALPVAVILPLYVIELGVTEPTRVALWSGALTAVGSIVINFC